MRESYRNSRLLNFILCIILLSGSISLNGWSRNNQTQLKQFLNETHQIYDMTDRYQEFNYNTLSGLILELLQHIPTENKKVDWLCFTLEIVDMDGARIDKVLVHKHETPQEEN